MSHHFIPIRTNRFGSQPLSHELARTRSHIRHQHPYAKIDPEPLVIYSDILGTDRVGLSYEVTEDLKQQYIRRLRSNIRNVERKIARLRSGNAGPRYHKVVKVPSGSTYVPAANEIVVDVSTFDKAAGASLVVQVQESSSPKLDRLITELGRLHEALGRVL